MKYKVQDLFDGTFAVGYGKNKYFRSTVSQTHDEAMKLCCEMSALWYQRQIDKCCLKWYEVNPEGTDTEWGDKLA
jgi:hypothetical protein